MKRTGAARVAVSLPLAWLATAPVQAQTASIKPVLVKDPAAVLKLVRGEVMMVGSTFPNMAFQKGILSLFRSRAITKLTVLTTAQNAATYAPLRALGAQVYYLPVAGVNMSGNVVFAGTDTAIMSNTPGQWYVVRGPQVGAQGRASMGLYLKSAKKY
ncbi:hypothetical protein [Deinococcus sp. S9]|uniref:hypothetical protein n=1 Tax=Deinococcus sp. S9 TaxID=2545754 RepID=UPI0010548466|nr:hypothetical protein [Deinococcus sp. S9]TDE84958.1 hypothetical protein E0686_14330 [Deinococcus sp. S9]